MSNILNIGLQLIEALIVFCFFENVSLYKENALKKLSLITGMYLVMCAFNLLFHYNVLVNAILLAVCLFVFSRIIYKNNTKISIIYSLVISCLVFITELMVISLLSVIFKTDSKEFIEDIPQYILVIILSKSLLFLILKIISDIIVRNRAKQKISYPFFIYPFSLLIVLIDFAIIYYNAALSDKIKYLLCATSIFLIFSIVIFCIFQQKSSQKEQELIELKAIKQRQDIENTYFDLLEHQNDELQIFVHDMQKHLNNIYGLSSDSDRAKQYIENLSKDLSDSNIVGKTSNKMLDLIIDKYTFLSKKQNITFNIDIHSSNINFIKDSDLTSVFNNLLDNALEAAAESQEKIIELSINTCANMLSVCISNSCDNAPLISHNILLTTKKEKNLHGFGFKSVNRTVKKYNGDLDWEYNETEHIFYVSILFPLCN